MRSVHYHLYDVAGMLVKRGSSLSPSAYFELSLADVPVGVYVLFLSDGDISQKKMLFVLK